jgi:hypothetical protein
MNRDNSFLCVCRDRAGAFRAGGLRAANGTASEVESV